MTGSVGRIKQRHKHAELLGQLSGIKANKLRQILLRFKDTLIPKAGRALSLTDVFFFTVPPPTDVEVICQNLNVHVRWNYSRAHAQSSFTVTLNGNNRCDLANWGSSLSITPGNSLGFPGWSLMGAAVVSRCVKR